MSDHQMWAYCDVRSDGTITYYGVAEDHHTQARPNVHAVNALRWVEEAVAWLGTQGWELVSVVEGTDRTFYFKRPLQEQGAEILAEAIGLETATAAVIEPNPDATEERTEPVIDPARLIEEEFLPD
jgi:hypothetical protein